MRRIIFIIIVSLILSLYFYTHNFSFQHNTSDRISEFDLNGIKDFKEKAEESFTESDDGSINDFIKIINRKSFKSRREMGARMWEESLSVNFNIINEYLSKNPQSLAKNPELRAFFSDMYIIDNNKGVSVPIHFDEELAHLGYLFFPRNKNIDDDVFVPCETEVYKIKPSKEIYWAYPENYNFDKYDLSYNVFTVNEYNEDDFLGEAYGDGMILRPRFISTFFLDEIAPLLPQQNSYWEDFIKDPKIFSESISQHEIIHIVLGQFYDLHNTGGQLSEKLVEIQNKIDVPNKTKLISELHEFIAMAGNFSVDERAIAPEIVRLIHRRTYNKLNDQYNYSFDVLEKQLSKCLPTYDAIDSKMKEIESSDESNADKQKEADTLLEDLFVKIKESELVCIQSSIKDIASLYLQQLKSGLYFE